MYRMRAETKQITSCTCTSCTDDKRALSKKIYNINLKNFRAGQRPNNLYDRFYFHFAHAFVRSV